MSNKITLNAIGEQDNYLKVNPVTTHLKTKHQTHTNFAKNLLLVSPTSEVSSDTTYALGDTIIFEIEKSADLLLKLNLQLKVEGSGWAQNNMVVPQTMYALIDYIEICSDTTVLQRLYGNWIYLWNQLKDPTEKQNIPQHAYASNQNKVAVNPEQHLLNLDIPFWFESNPGLALPLWALQHERIYVKLKLKSRDEIISIGSLQSSFIVKDIRLLLEIVDLDQNEKSKFQNTPLEYLIEQVEFTDQKYIESNMSTRQKVELQQYPFVNEIIWFFSGTDFTGNIGPNNYFNFWKDYDGNPETRVDHTGTVSILLNGNPVNPRFKSSYYRKVQRFQSHATGPVYNSSLDSDNTNISSNCIYSYNFGFYPENVKPSGFLSTTKFNQIILDLQVFPSQYKRYLNIFLKRFNIIRIRDGHINIMNT